MTGEGDPRTARLAPRRWTRADGGKAYAGTCPQEYWAELTMWYFGSHGEFVDRQAKTPHPGPGGLAEYDPDGFRRAPPEQSPRASSFLPRAICASSLAEISRTRPPNDGGVVSARRRLLASIYGGTLPGLDEAEPVLHELIPLVTGGAGGAAPAEGGDESAVSPAAEEVEVTVEFDNRDLDCEWSLSWVTPEAERLPYGRVGKEAALSQQTFAGHVWELTLSAESESDRLCAARVRQLRYAASRLPCVANVAKDARQLREGEHSLARERVEPPSPARELKADGPARSTADCTSASR